MEAFELIGKIREELKISNMKIADFDRAIGKTIKTSTYNEIVYENAIRGIEKLIAEYDENWTGGDEN